MSGASISRVLVSIITLFFARNTEAVAGRSVAPTSVGNDLTLPSLFYPARAIASIVDDSVAIVTELASLHSAISTSIVAYVDPADNRARIASLHATRRRTTVSSGNAAVVTLLCAMPVTITALGKGVHIRAHSTPVAPTTSSLNPDAALDAAVRRKTANEGLCC